MILRTLFAGCTLLIISLAPRLSAQDTSSTETLCSDRFHWAAVRQLAERPINEILAAVGASFLGSPYVAHSLESADTEQLVVNLRAFDCVTFYENALALARCIAKRSTTFDDFRRELTLLRYRGGVIDGYASRLHYTSDYFFDNERKGVLHDMTRELGGIRFEKHIDFMSTHPGTYPVLQRHPEFVKQIVTIEDSINARVAFYIPKRTVKSISSKLKDGDIIAITTAIDGIDCSHTGIAVWRDGQVRLMHAPVPGSTVQITKLPLWEYLAKIKNDTGIMVARPLEPR